MLHSTLHTVHWYGNRGKMYKTVQITCFTKVFYVTAFGFVGCIFFGWLKVCSRFLSRKIGCPNYPHLLVRWNMVETNL